MLARFSVSLYAEVVLKSILFIVAADEEEVGPQEDVATETPPAVVEVMDNPSEMDKGKGVAVPESPKLINVADEVAGVEAARDFVRLKVRRTEPSLE